MASTAVRQSGPLSDLFAEALRLRRPGSVAVLGIAGGNGLERIDPAVTTRIVGVDLNPGYLLAVRQRFPSLAGLELHCADLARETLSLESVRLVHAALIFEHAGFELCLDNALSMVAADGAISVVLQLPGEHGHEVGQSGVASMTRFTASFQFIDPGDLQAEISVRGFTLEYATRHELAAGKALWMGILVRAKRNSPILPSHGTKTQ